MNARPLVPVSQKGPNLPSPEVPAAAVFGPPVAAARLACARVLVVEDEADSRELICALLEMAGATVLSTASVAEAMDGVYHSFDPDVVLTDFSMPDANGLDLIREFRKAPSARTVEVPIIFLSGHSGDNWRARALEAGAADLLSKPFEPTLLISRIAAAVAPGRNGPH
jgi:CheY-like chemotaxis protein